MEEARLAASTKIREIQEEAEQQQIEQDLEREAKQQAAEVASKHTNEMGNT